MTPPSEDQLHALELHEQRQSMEASGNTVFLLYAFTIWLIGVMVAVGVNVNEWFGVSLYSFGSDPLVPFFLLTVFAFLASAMFFGKAAPLVFMYLGLVSGSAMSTQFLLGAFSFIPFAIASHAGMSAGFALYDDFHGKDNVFSKSKQILAPLGIALGLSVIVSLGANSLGDLNNQLVSWLKSFRGSF